MTALSTHYTPTFLTAKGRSGYVLHIVVQKTLDIVSATDGYAYKRHNAQNLRVTGDDNLQRLRLDKGIVSFEDEVVNVDERTVVSSRTSASFISEIVPSSDAREWMRKQNLFSGSRPIVANVLLFSDEPQAALPKRSGIKIYRYKTKEEEGNRDQLAFQPISIEGALYDQIKNAVAKTKSVVEEMKALTPVGLAAVTYPDETLHEILTNAVLHRDYSIATDIHIRIFDNRIEVESPGRLAGHVTSQNILREQFARNPKIVRLINKFPNPPNKDIGEGLNTAFESMKKLRLKEPEIGESANSVIVHIRHSALASPQDAVMSYLEDHHEITNKIGRELTGITSENVMKDVFISLSKRKMLERVPGKRGNASAWQKHTN